MSDALGGPGVSRHVISDLGLEVRLSGDELIGGADIFPELTIPDTDCLRASVLAAWVDVLTGIICLDAFGGRVPVTLDLDLQLFGPPVGYHRVEAVTRTVKVGRSIAIAEVEFTADDESEPIGLGSASFVAAPDPSLTLPTRAENVESVMRHRGRLTAPFAERAGCERDASGVVSLARRDDGLNAAGTINGGLIALVIEEAALARAPGLTLASMAIRYLRAARVGPIAGTADRHGQVARVEVRDTGSDDRLVARAMTQTFSV